MNFIFREIYGLRISQWFIIIGIIMILLGTSLDSFSTKHKAPPGYIIVTDGKGHYAAALTNLPGLYLDHRSHYRPLTSRQQAINRAWEQVEYEQEEAKKASQWRNE